MGNNQRKKKGGSQKEKQTAETCGPNLKHKAAWVPNHNHNNKNKKRTQKTEEALRQHCSKGGK
jgi:hypothetical protein